MSSVEAYFMGGPADGRHLAVSVGEDGVPVKTVEVLQPNFAGRMDPETGAYLAADIHDTPSYTTVVYQRQASQLDDGPLWVYAPTPNEPGH